MSTSRYHQIIVITMGILLLVLIGIRNAHPIEDGDFFWNIAYGKYLIEHRTLIPDHTVYSWTLADNSVVKNEWLSEIALYAIYKAGGLNALFVLKYLIVLLMLVMLICFIRKMGQPINPLHMILIPVFLFSSKSGTAIKPELFSLIFFTFLNYLLFSIRVTLAEKGQSKLIYLLPLLFLVWVNSHGAVLFAMILYVLFFVGELLNQVIGPNRRPASAYIKRHFVSLALCGVSFFITPYGYKFPQRLIYLVLGADHENYQTIAAYLSIFDQRLAQNYYLEYGALMLAPLLFLLINSAWKQKRLDWAIALPNVMLALLFAKYARATYFWPSFWAFSVVYLSNQAGIHPTRLKGSIQKIISTACLILLLLFFWRIYDEKFKSTETGGWFGFGTGHYNPVQASDFVKTHHPGSLLYNSYSIGGYLVWDLYPAYKVFVDPRYFPYHTWIKEYQQFNYADTPLKAFSQRYPFDLAILDYVTSKRAIHKFNTSDEWRLVFYGPSAVVFVKNDTGFEFDLGTLDKKRFENLKNKVQAESIFFFTLDVGEYETSKFILETIRKEYIHTYGYSQTLLRCELALRGIEAYENRNYSAALKYLETLGRKRYAYKSNRYLMNLRYRIFKNHVDSRDYEFASNILKKSLSEVPNDPAVLFNMGVLSYIAANESQKIASYPDWRERFEKIVENGAKNEDRFEITKKAEDILAGKVVPNAGMFILD